MKLELPYVQTVKVKGRSYYYFRNQTTGKRIKLDGRPGSREFEASYQSALLANGPKRPARATGAGRGSLAWVTERYKATSLDWEKATASTREVYDRRHHWLVKNYGAEPIWEFDRAMMKRIRDLPEFADKRSVADSVVARFATLWDFAEEHLDLDELAALNGANPARNIKKLTSDDESESAPVWPLELCKLVEKCASPDIRKFYFLGRYTGQRRSDLAEIEWEHFDFDANTMFVMQLKTRARIWVPLPEALRLELDRWERAGRYVVMSPKKQGEAWAHTSITNEIIVTTRDLGFQTTDSKGKPRFYSPHGLRHLCGIELAHAGASDNQIAAVLGHSTLKQVKVYTAQANQLLLARGAQNLRDAMYRQQLHDEAIRAASNVTKLRA
jgi:integrase